MPATVQGRLPASCESKVGPVVFLPLTKLINYWGGLWHTTIIAKWTLRWCAESPMVLFFKETKGWVSLGLSVLPVVMVLVRGGISTVSPHIRGLQIHGFNQLWIKIFEKKKKKKSQKVPTSKTWICCIVTTVYTLYLQLFTLYWVL